MPGDLSDWSTSLLSPGSEQLSLVTSCDISLYFPAINQDNYPRLQITLVNIHRPKGNIYISFSHVHLLTKSLAGGGPRRSKAFCLLFIHCLIFTWTALHCTKTECEIKYATVLMQHKIKTFVKARKLCSCE